MKQETRRDLIKVAFLHDTDLNFVGGAELSNLSVIQAGAKHGFEVFPDALKSFRATRALIDHCDLMIVNSIFGCRYEYELIGWLIKGARPYVRWEHDYGFCTERSAICFTDPNAAGCRKGVRFHCYRDLFASALLNVFQSPLHLKIHYEIYGDAIEPTLVFPPPISVDKIHVAPKEPGTVAFVGKIDALKGDAELYRYAVSRTDLSFFVCGSDRSGKKWPPNVQMLGEVSNEEVLNLLSWCERFFFKPLWPEPGGRSAMEAFLSGCKMDINDHVGSATFDFYLLDPEKAKDVIAKSPALFWTTIRRMLQTRTSSPCTRPRKESWHERAIAIWENILWRSAVTFRGITTCWRRCRYHSRTV